jgi:hypothetical protein
LGGRKQTMAEYVIIIVYRSFWFKHCGNRGYSFFSYFPVLCVGTETGRSKHESSL